MNEDAVVAKNLGSPDQKPWYVVQIKPNSESIAKKNLLRQDVQVFAPYEDVTLRKASKLVHTTRMLFPGYLFVSFHPETVRWRTINSTLGVNRLVSFVEGRPALVPMDLVSSLMRRCDPSGKLLPQQLLSHGAAIRVANGAFVDFVGTVEELAPDQRIWVLLDILGKSTRVAIRPENLSLAK